MKTNLFDELLASIPADISREVDLAFDISDRIHELLQATGMTQKELAQKMGKRESEVSKLLRGTHNFTLRTISKLEMALGNNIINVARKQQRVSEVKCMFVTISSEDRTVRPEGRISNIPFSSRRIMTKIN